MAEMLMSLLGSAGTATAVPASNPFTSLVQGAEQGTVRNFLGRVMGGAGEGATVASPQTEATPAATPSATPAPAPAVTEAPIKTSLRQGVEAAASPFDTGALPVPFIDELRNGILVGAGVSGAPRGTGVQPPRSKNLTDTMGDIVSIDRTDIPEGADVNEFTRQLMQKKGQINGQRQ